MFSSWTQYVLMNNSYKQLKIFWWVTFITYFSPLILSTFNAKKRLLLRIYISCYFFYFFPNVRKIEFERGHWMRGEGYKVIENEQNFKRKNEHLFSSTKKLIDFFFYLVLNIIDWFVLSIFSPPLLIEPGQLWDVSSQKKLNYVPFFSKMTLVTFIQLTFFALHIFF